MGVVLLPNFLIIGAAKAGTNALHTYLRDHPDVFMPAEKELKFFSHSENWEKGLSWYQEQFAEAGDVKAAGEGSVQYSMYPNIPEVPQKIASVLPEVRIIYLVRHPFDRMLSQYRMLYSQGKETGSFEQALLRPAPPGDLPTRFHGWSNYVYYSLYAAQIDRYLEYFDKDRILTVQSESLLRDRPRTLSNVCRFLEVDPEWDSEVLDREFATAIDRRVSRAPKLQATFRRTRLNRILDRVAPSLKLRVRRVFMRNPNPREELSVLSDNVRGRLEDVFAEDIARLRTHLPADFDGWGIA